MVLKEESNERVELKGVVIKRSVFKEGVVLSNRKSGIPRTSARMQLLRHSGSLG